MDLQLTFRQYAAQKDRDWWRKDEDYRRQFYQDYLRSRNADLTIPDRNFAATLKTALNWEQTVAAGDALRGRDNTVAASPVPISQPAPGNLGADSKTDYDPEETWGSYARRVDPAWWTKDEAYQIQFRKSFLAAKGLADPIVLGPDQAAALKKALAGDNLLREAPREPSDPFQAGADRAYSGREENRQDVIKPGQVPAEESPALLNMDSKIVAQIQSSPKYASIVGPTGPGAEIPAAQNTESPSLIQYAGHSAPDWQISGNPPLNPAPAPDPASTQPASALSDLAGKTTTEIRMLQLQSTLAGAPGLQINVSLGPADFGSALDLNYQPRPINADLPSQAPPLQPLPFKEAPPREGRSAIHFKTETIAAPKPNQQTPWGTLESRKKERMLELAAAAADFAQVQAQTGKILADPGKKSQAALVWDINTRYTTYLRGMQARIKDGQVDENIKIMRVGDYVKSAYKNVGNVWSNFMMQPAPGPSNAPAPLRDNTTKGNAAKMGYQAAAENAIKKNHSISGAIASLAKSGLKPGNPVIEELVKRYNAYHSAVKKVTNYTARQYFEKFIH